MSGFGIRALKKLKEESHKEDKRQFIPHIVYGENFYAIYTFIRLREKYGESNVLLISQNPIDQQTILNEWKCSLNTLRNEVAAKKIMDLRPALEIFPTSEPVAFYKDTKFHEFGGRAKPYELMEDEEYFTDPAFNIKLSGLFTDQEWNDLDEALLKQQNNKYIKEIERTEPTDLVEKVNFKLHTGEYESFECENLYWCESPKDFYKLVKNKNNISDATSAYCSALEERTGLTIHFEADKEIYEKMGTVLLPQSVTHEWGHFICDFEKFDPVKKKQEFKAMMFINLDEVNEEELAKKIKHMKRVIERIMPEMANTRYTEHIHYDQSILIKNFNDEVFFKENNDKNCLHFRGIGAPIETEIDMAYIARGLYSLLAIEY